MSARHPSAVVASTGEPAARDHRKCLPLAGAGRLLDFGCGGGSYLLRMHEQGWDVTGLDLAAAALETIPPRRGLRHAGRLTAPSAPSR